MSLHTFTDEPIDLSFDDIPAEESDARWDYVEDDDAPSRPFATGLRHARQHEELPAKLRELVEWMEREPWSVSRAKTFYEQAHFMADYKDQADIVPFSALSPTYASMTVAQLRSYFSLRHLWRLGHVPEAPLSYVFVYVYELLIGVGTSSAAEAFDTMQWLLASYGRTERQLAGHLEQWLKDFAVYHQLAAQAQQVFASELAASTMQDAIASPQQADDATLCKAFEALTRHKFSTSALFKQLPLEAPAALAAVVRHLSELLPAQAGITLAQIFFETEREVSTPMFTRAVFYNPTPTKEATFVVGHGCRYRCHNGLWTKVVQPLLTIHSGTLTPKSLAHDIERQLRLALKAKGKLKPTALPDDIRRLVSEAIRAYLRDKAEAARPRIEVDMSKLAGIRADADVVRDALLTDEEREGMAVEAAAGAGSPISGSTSAAPIAAAETAQPPASTAPRPAESPSQEAPAATWETFLHTVLCAGDWREVLQKAHVPLGVMIDSVNEALWDELADTALTEEGGQPVVVDDYHNDLMQLLGLA